MSKEKFVLAFVAITLGLIVAGGAFYIYQSTKVIDEPKPTQNNNTNVKPSPVPQNENLLVVNEPKDEQVFSKTIINIKGKTTADATIVVSTESSDEIFTPSKNGDFSLTHTLQDGVNVLRIAAIFPNGEEQTVVRTVTSTTEDF